MYVCMLHVQKAAKTCTITNAGKNVNINIRYKHKTKSTTKQQNEFFYHPTPVIFNILPGKRSSEESEKLCQSCLSMRLLLYKASVSVLHVHLCGCENVQVCDFFCAESVSRLCMHIGRLYASHVCVNVCWVCACVVSEHVCRYIHLASVSDWATVCEA